MLRMGNSEDKVAIINTLLNRIIVYKDRVEIFINLLPVANTNIDLQITNKDLTTYSLLETNSNEKIALTSDFPSDKTLGAPKETRTPNLSVRSRTLYPIEL